jgi:protein-S-isoprenylcysteine O-methyltransferase Ste14
VRPRKSCSSKTSLASFDCANKNEGKAETRRNAATKVLKNIITAKDRQAIMTRSFLSSVPGFRQASDHVDFMTVETASGETFVIVTPSLDRSRLGLSYRAMLELRDLLDDRGIMNFDQNSPTVGEPRTPAPFLGRPLWNWVSVRIALAFRVAKRNLSALVSKDLVLDLVERAVVLILFLFFANKMFPRFAGLIVTEVAHPELLWLAASTNLEAALLVISESLGVFLILTRRPATTVSTRPSDWALSLMAVNAPLLVAPAAASTFLPSQIAPALMVAGMIIQISAKAALWRSFGLVPANRGIKTGGPYRFVRHPMYAGYTLTHIGFLLGFPSLQNSLLYLIALLIEVARLLREELVLNQDPLYRKYADRVRYRLLPGVF